MRKLVPVLFLMLLVTVLIVAIPFAVQQRAFNEEMKRQGEMQRASVQAEKEEELEEWKAQQSPAATEETESETASKEEKSYQFRCTDRLDKEYKGVEANVSVHADIYVPEAPLYRYEVKRSGPSVSAEEMIELLMDGQPVYKDDIKYDYYIYETEDLYQSLESNLMDFFVTYKTEPEGSDTFYEDVSEEEARRACMDFLNHIGIPVDETYYQVNKGISELADVPAYGYRFYGTCDGVRVSGESYGMGDPVVDLISGEWIEIEYGPEGICCLFVAMHRSAKRVGEEIPKESLITADEACELLLEDLDYYENSVGIEEIWLVYLPGTEEGDEKIGGKFFPFWELRGIDGHN